MRTGKDRVQVESVNTSVSLGDVRVNAGDLIVGDRDGVVVIPLSKAQQVLDQALKIHEAEKAILSQVNAGATLKQARETLGYHTLQRGSSTT